MQRPDGQRGQIIIVAALVIAAIFVGLALVLNSGIYAENLSSRETSETSDALTFASEAHGAVVDAYETANAENATTADEAREAFNGTVDKWATVRQRRAASRGTIAETDRTPHAGWRLEQAENGSFTPDGAPGTENWQVVYGTDGIAKFEVNVTREDLYDAAGNFDDTSENAFNVTVHSGSDEWELHVFRDSVNDSIVVHAGDPDDAPDLGTLRLNSTHTCIADESYATVDFRAERLADSDCPALNFSDNVSGSVDIHYGNVKSGGGDERVNGTYSLVVNGSGAVVDSNFNDPGGDTPTAQAVVYSASYATRYERSDLRYTRATRYAPRNESYTG